MLTISIISVYRTICDTMTVTVRLEAVRVKQSGCFSTQYCWEIAIPSCPCRYCWVINVRRLWQSEEMNRRCFHVADRSKIATVETTDRNHWLASLYTRPTPQSRGYGLNRSFFAFPNDISKTDAAIGSLNLTHERSTMNHENPFMLRSKGQRSRSQHLWPQLPRQGGFDHE